MNLDLTEAERNERDHAEIWALRAREPFIDDRIRDHNRHLRPVRGVPFYTPTRFSDPQWRKTEAIENMRRQLVYVVFFLLNCYRIFL